MHWKTFTFIILLSILLIPKSKAQHAGSSLISLSWGAVSYDEWKGVFTPENDKMSWPDKISGANFLTYRFFVSKDIAIGFTAGFDGQRGQLTTGNPEVYPNSQNTQTGNYVRMAYTIAPEVLVQYWKHRCIKLYGSYGIGYTYFSIKNTYFDGTANTYTNNHYNAQISPIGIRIGHKIAGFAEIGYGYKGLFNGGVSVKF